MKKLIVGALSIALLAGGMSSCKKGENDPFLSLKSRKGRMAGEWTVTKLTSTEVDTPAGGTASTSTTTVDGSTLTMVESSGGNSTTTNGTINTATMSIKKMVLTSKSLILRSLLIKVVLQLLNNK